MDQKPQTSVISAWKATEFVWDVLIAIALPTTLSALGGRWVDQRYNVAPWGIVLGLVFALAISGALVYRQAKRYKKEFFNS